MASNNKRKTTMAKIDRESRLRDRRMKKAIRRDARKNAPPEAVDPEPDTLTDADTPADAQDPAGVAVAPASE
jgi:hypothetical protein